MSALTTDYFATELRHYKELIDQDISQYWQRELPLVQRDFGTASAAGVGALAEIMGRGGKRIRGTLAIVAYQLFGGRDEAVMIPAARAIEMIHAYMLMVDDIADRSLLRRGGPTAHIQLEAWHKAEGMQGDGHHFGASVATLAGIYGSHKAMQLIGELPVAAERRLLALENVNRHLLITCHGQFNDLANEAQAVNDEQRVEDVLVWKTAYYTFANPLQFGALLAGADQAALDQLMSYSLAAGRAFQLSDDVIGTFGDTTRSGKSSMEDIQEGKRTLLVVKALEAAPAADAAFLRSRLGQQKLSLADFNRCKAIITDSGALKAATEQISLSSQAARAALVGGVLPENSDGVHFLDGLAAYLTNRQA